MQEKLEKQIFSLKLHPQIFRPSNGPARETASKCQWQKEETKSKTWINYSFASVEPWLQYSKDIICTAASSKRRSHGTIVEAFHTLRRT